MRVVRLLLADPNGVNEQKGGPQKAAAGLGQKKIYLFLLLDCGANVEARLAEALCATARGGNKDLVETLLGRGPPVNKGLEVWVVLRSLGGATADFEVPDAGLAEEPVQTMWRLFLGGANNFMTEGIQPFGIDVVLDGIDICECPLASLPPKQHIQRVCHPIWIFAIHQSRRRWEGALSFCCSSVPSTRCIPYGLSSSRPSIGIILGSILQ